MKLKNTLFVLLVLSVILSAGVPTMAQDKIITKEGETHEVYNVEVSDKYVFYSKEKAADSPILRMGKDVVLMIRYQDGTKKLFTGEEAGDEASLAGSNVASSGTSAKQEAAEDVSLSEEELTKLKNQYWVEVGYKNDKELDKGDKEAKSMFCQFDFCHDAVLADKNVELQVKTLKTDMDSYKYASWWQATNYAVQITVCNKTNQVIYIDLGNCFFIRGSEASPFYIPTSTS